MNIKELEEKILYHKDKYYNGTAEISDYEYDQLENKLRGLNPNSDVFKKVGAEPKDKYKHSIWMPSIEKFNKTEDVQKWIEKQENNPTFTFKLDGSSMALYYKDGKFVKALTRGDGYYGEDRTEFFDYINIPKRFNDFTGVVWGEVLIKKTMFQSLQKQMEQKGLYPVKSIRNAVAGILNRKEHKELSAMFDFVAHNVFSFVTFSFMNDLYHYKKLAILQDNYFFVPFFDYNFTIKEMIDYYINNKDEYPYLTDGIVITQNCNGYDLNSKTGHHYKWNIAYKLESETAITTVKDILRQTGRTGKITPVLIVEPTELSGCTINNVTAHNFKMMIDNNICIGSKIRITRANEVIPKFLETIDSYNSEVYIPRECPKCYSLLEWSETKTDLYCTNDSCPAIIKGKLVNFCKTLDIEGINDSIADRLVERFNITNPFMIYSLDINDLLTVDGFKQRMAEKIYNNIQVSLNNPLITKAKLVESLGIKNIGGTVSVKIQDNGLLDSSSSIKDLQIDGIGEVIKETIKDNIEYIKEQLELAKEIGFDYPFREQIEEVIGVKKFSDLSFILSGSFSKKKADIEKLITDLGGKIEKSVNKNLNVLITNETGTNKCIKAKEMNVQIKSESELYEWIEK